jgi:hypothetical protein
MTGEVEASSPEAAIVKLRARNLYPTNVRDTSIPYTDQDEIEDASDEEHESAQPIGEESNDAEEAEDEQASDPIRTTRASKKTRFWTFSRSRPKRPWEAP